MSLKPLCKESREEEHAPHAQPVETILSPKEAYLHIVDVGAAKCNLRFDRHVVLSILAGMYIGFSFMLCMAVGGQIPKIQSDYPGIYNFIFGAVGFPLGLTVIIVTGADLFTSDCTYMMAALHEGRVTVLQVARVWFHSWWFNLAGGLIMAAITHGAWVFHGREAFTLALAEHKCSYPFGVSVCKGILANWLVNLAVWMANSSNDFISKAVSVYLPVQAFVTLGLEHCIANQYLLSLAKMLGSDLEIRTIIVHNLIPATIGNIIGGAFFVGTLYSLCLGSLFDATYDNVRRLTKGKIRMGCLDRTRSGSPSPSQPGRENGREITPHVVAAITSPVQRRSMPGAAAAGPTTSITGLFGPQHRDSDSGPDSNQDSYVSVRVGGSGGGGAAKDAFAPVVDV